MKKYFLKFIVISVIILGIITPYIDYFVVIQTFFLLIPFIGILLFSLILFITNLFKNRKNVFTLKSTKIITIIPLFLLAQIISVFIIHKVQRFRSEQIIENLKSNYKYYPQQLPTNYGIKYYKLKDLNEFRIEYERGFFVREVYDSTVKAWESYGWND